MLGSRVSLPFFSGLRRIEGGSGMPVIILQVCRKKVKVTNIPMPGKKGFAKPKSAKKGDDSSEAYSDVVPFESGLPPIGNIVLESSPPPFGDTYSSVRPTASKSKFATPQLSTDAPPSNRTRGSKRKTSPPSTSTTTERRVCYL